MFGVHFNAPNGSKVIKKVQIENCYGLQELNRAKLLFDAACIQFVVSKGLVPII